MERKRIVADLTDFQAWMNITKSGMGLGLLTVPMAIGKVGAVPGIICWVVIACSSLWMAVLVAKCKDKIEYEDSTESRPLRMAEAGGGADASKVEEIWDSGLGYYDEVLARAFGPGGRAMLILAILGCQIFTVVAYMSTIAESVPASFSGWNRNRTLLATCIVCSVMSLTNRLRRVAYLSAAGALIYLFVFACLGYEAWQNTHPTTMVLWKRTGYDYGLIFATASFVFGSLIISDCVHKEMKNKENFVQVATLSYLAVMVGGLCFSLLGFYVYGDQAEDIIYLSFPSSTRAACVVCVTVILAISIILALVPVFMFLQVQLPSVPYSILNISVVCVMACMAYLLPDVITALETVNNVVDLIALWIMPAACFFCLTHRYERCEQCVTALALLVGIVASTAALCSA